MRIPATLLATSLLTACTSTFAEPRILVTPYLAVYQLRGNVALQSQPDPAGPLQDNAAQSLDSFGQGTHREDVGVRFDLGDGFAGLRVDYYKLDQNAPSGNALTADWGELLATDVVKMRAGMDDLRIAWLEPVWLLRTSYRDRPLTMRLAAGGMLTYRDLALRAQTEDGVRAQHVKIEGELLSAALRFRASWRDFAFDLDYAVSPDLVLGGDFDGLQQDFEVRASYTLPLHDVTFSVGYRYTEMRADGTADGFGYDASLKLDGFQFGVGVTF